MTGPPVDFNVGLSRFANVIVVFLSADTLALFLFFEMYRVRRNILRLQLLVPRLPILSETF